LNHKHVLLILTSILLILVSIFLIITYRYPPEQWIEKETSTTEYTHLSNTTWDTGIHSGIRIFRDENELLSFLNNIINYFEKPYQEGYGLPALFPRELKEGLNRYSQTNIQVRGVDEPDIVKTNGRVIAYAYGKNIYIIDTSTDTLKSIIKLDNSTLVDGLFLYRNNLIVIATSGSQFVRIYRPAPIYNDVSTIIVIYNISDSANPIEIYRLTVSGWYFGSRLVDKYLYVLTNTEIYTPFIPLINGREMDVEKISLISLKPTNYLTIIAVDLEELIYNYASFLIDRSSLLYVSHSRIYVGRLIWGSIWEPEILIELSRMINVEVYREIVELLDQGRIYDAYILLASKFESKFENSLPNNTLMRNGRFYWNISLSDKTIFYVFEYMGLDINFSLAFQVNGIVLDQFAMEELNDNFVVATTCRRLRLVSYRSVVQEYTVSTTPLIMRGSSEEKLSTQIILIWLEPEAETSNNVYIINMSVGELAGKLENLAPGERIYSARLVKNILFLVTYRNVDPLFAIDLTNISNPVILGFLKIPGFSEYLHPIGNELLLGLGIGSKDETGQAEFGLLKFSLFNVTEPSNMSEISYIVLNGWSTALYDHHAVTIDYEYGRVYIPMNNATHWGVIVLKIVYSERIGLVIEGFLQHDGATRTLYVDNKIYTIGGYIIRIYENESLKQINEIALPQL